MQWALHWQQQCFDVQAAVETATSSGKSCTPACCVRRFQWDLADRLFYGHSKLSIMRSFKLRRPRACHRSQLLHKVWYSVTCLPYPRRARVCACYCLRALATRLFSSQNPAFRHVLCVPEPLRGIMSRRWSSAACAVLLVALCAVSAHGCTLYYTKPSEVPELGGMRIRVCRSFKPSGAPIRVPHDTISTK